MAEFQEMKFPCTACGKCCRKVGSCSETQFLDRGDSICRFFNEETNLCSIYEDRPLVCRVEDYYKIYLVDKIGWAEFIEVNLIICSQL